MLELKSVSKVFNKEEENEFTALQGVNLNVEEGDFVVISGPSGSGKTTLLNLIGALDAPTEGEIFLEGREITALKERELSSLRKTSIGFVFQAYNLIPVLTAYENIEYIMKLQGKSDDECLKRVEELSGILQISDILEKLPSHLSGGQQQRVAVARAVASKPKLILADEPTANLDSENAQTLIAMMEELNKKEKITVIFSSHDPLVIGKAKTSVVLRDGIIVK